MDLVHFSNATRLKHGGYCTRNLQVKSIMDDKPRAIGEGSCQNKYWINTLKMRYSIFASLSNF